jgi:hypothetical protein
VQQNYDAKSRRLSPLLTKHVGSLWHKALQFTCYTGFNRNPVTKCDAAGKKHISCTRHIRVLARVGKQRRQRGSGGLRSQKLNVSAMFQM